MLDSLSPLQLTRDVEVHEHRPRAKAIDYGNPTAVIYVGRYHARPLGGKQGCLGGALPISRTGDQHNLAVKSAHTRTSRHLNATNDCSAWSTRS
jgi:hypothetical protein